METTPLGAGETPRAFEILNHLPASCRLLPVRDDFAEPHLHAGELAVIEPLAAGVRIANGLAVALRQSNGQHQFWSLRRYPPGEGPFGPLAMPRGERPETIFGINPLMKNSPDAVAALRRGERVNIRLSDGEQRESLLRPRIIGRIVGILAASAAFEAGRVLQLPRPAAGGAR